MFVLLNVPDPLGVPESLGVDIELGVADTLGVDVRLALNDCDTEGEVVEEADGVRVAA